MKRRKMPKMKFIQSRHKTKKAAEKQARKSGGTVSKTPKSLQNLHAFKGKPYVVKK